MAQQASEDYHHIPITGNLIPSLAAQQLALIPSVDIGQVVGGPAWERRKQHILAHPGMVSATPRDSEALLSMAKLDLVIHPNSGASARGPVAVAVRCVEMSVLLDLCSMCMPPGGDLATCLDRMTNETRTDAQRSAVGMIQRCKLRIIVDALLDAKAAGLPPWEMPQWSRAKGLFLTNWTVEPGYGPMGVVRLRVDEMAKRFTPQGPYLLDAAANERNIAALGRVMANWTVDECYTFLVNIAKRGDVQLLEWPDRHRWEVSNHHYIISR